MTSPSYTINNICVSRKEALTLIYRHTHADFKGKVFNPDWGHENIGKRTLLVNGGGAGTCLVLLDDLSDDEVKSRLPLAIRDEARRLLAKKAKAKG